MKKGTVFSTQLDLKEYPTRRQWIMIMRRLQGAGIRTLEQENNFFRKVIGKDRMTSYRDIDPILEAVEKIKNEK